MYGFKPRHAQGKPVQNLADGGIVHSLTGMLGMRKRTPDEIRADDAKAQERNQKAADAIAERAKSAPQAVAKTSPEKAISEYSGMSAMQRREKELGLKDGGVVPSRGFKAGGLIRGPGTGTSDSIETEKRPGTFIMPADSTKAIGPDALEEMGEVDDDDMDEQGEKMPVRLSNGEFELPPEQVQALGEAVLTVMRNATHKPAGQDGEPTGNGFAPNQFFVDGGVVEDDVTRLGAGAAPAAATTATTGAPTALPSTAPAAATPGAATAQAATPAANMGWAERNAMRNTQVTASSILDSPERQAAQAALAPKPELGVPAVQGLQTPAKNPAIAPMPGAPATSSGFKPRQAFAGGGTVKDEEQQRLANQTAMYVRGAQEAAANRPPEPQVAAASPVMAARPVQQADQQTTSPSALYMKDRADEISAQAGAGNYSQAVGTAARTAVQGLGMYGIEMADKFATPVLNAAAGFSRGVFGAENAEQPTAKPAAPAQKPVAVQHSPTPAAPVNAPAQARPQPQALITAQPPAQQGPRQIAKGVYESGRGQYSDNPTGEGMPASFTGQPSAQNIAAAEALQARGFTPGAVATQQAPQQIAAPVIRNSSNDWAARNNLRNLEVSASSIMANGGRFDQSGPGDSPEMAAYKAAIGTDQALQQAQPGMEKAAMDANAGITREGVQQDGATKRTGMQEQGANTRDAGRTAIARGELGIKQTAAGFQVRAAQQLEVLQNQYAAETDPAKQAALARQIREIQGKEQPARYKVAAGGQQIDANGVAYKVPDRVFNEQTGQFSDGTGAAPAPQAAPKSGEVRNGFRFKGGNPNEQANWTKV